MKFNAVQFIQDLEKVQENNPNHPIFSGRLVVTSSDRSEKRACKAYYYYSSVENIEEIKTAFKQLHMRNSPKVNNFLEGFITIHLTYTALVNLRNEVLLQNSRSTVIRDLGLMAALGNFVPSDMKNKNRLIASIPANQVQHYKEKALELIGKLEGVHMTVAHKLLCDYHEILHESSKVEDQMKEELKDLENFASTLCQMQQSILTQKQIKTLHKLYMDFTNSSLIEFGADPMTKLHKPLSELSTKELLETPSIFEEL